MKLLIVTQKVDTNDDVLGFFENWIRHIAREFTEVKVITLAKGEYNLPSNIEVFSLGKEKGRNKLSQAFIFYYYVLRFLPWSDGVFVHMAPEYVRALYPINMFLRKPICMWYAHIHVSKVGEWAMKHVTKIFSPSKESFAQVTEKVIATGHGIDTEIFEPNPLAHRASPPIVMTISRLSKVKRLHIFIEALHILRTQYPEISFQARIVGSPARPEDVQYEKELRELSKKYNLENSIAWYGSVKNKDTRPLYNEADVFVRLQGGGGFGKTELEAMSCGTPIVLCTDVYNVSLKEFTSDFYFSEDNALQCAERIRSVLLWSKEKRETYSRRSRFVVLEHHNLTHLAKRIAKEFNSLLT